MIVVLVDLKVEGREILIVLYPRNLEKKEVRREEEWKEKVRLTLSLILSKSKLLKLLPHLNTIHSLKYSASHTSFPFNTNISNFLHLLKISPKEPKCCFEI